MRKLTDAELDFVAAGWGGSLIDVDVNAHNILNNSLNNDLNNNQVQVGVLSKQNQTQ